VATAAFLLQSRGDQSGGCEIMNKAGIIAGAAFLLSAFSASSAAAQASTEFEDAVLTRPKTQVLDGRRYAAVSYADLKTYFDSLCRYDESARLIGRRVAVAAAFWSADSSQVTLDDGVYDALYNPDRPKSIISQGLGPGRFDPLFVRFKLGQIDRTSTFFSACDATLARFSKACVLAVYGVVRRKAVVGPKKGALASLLSPNECYLDVSGVRRIAVQDRTSWIGNAAIEGAIAGFNAGRGILPR
jgi:hypothetical protein